MRKASDLDSNNGDNLSTHSSMIPVNTSTGSFNNKTGKQMYLFYRTPSNKENKKIDFSGKDIKNNLADL
jgi:hypothetical protein